MVGRQQVNLYLKFENYQFLKLFPRKQSAYVDTLLDKERVATFTRGLCGECVFTMEDCPARRPWRDDPEDPAKVTDCEKFEKKKASPQMEALREVSPEIRINPPDPRSVKSTFTATPRPLCPICKEATFVTERGEGKYYCGQCLEDFQVVPPKKDWVLTYRPARQCSEGHTRIEEGDADHEQCTKCGATWEWRVPPEEVD